MILSYASKDTIVRGLLLLATMTLITVAPAGAREDEPRYFYWVKDRRQPLNLNTSVVLFMLAADRDALSAAADPEETWEELRNAPPPAPKPLQELVTEIEPCDPVRMWIATLKHEHGPDDMEQLVADLAAEENVVFAAPVFKTELGPIMMHPFVIAKRLAGTTDAQTIEAGMNAGAGEVVDWSYYGVAGYVRFRPATDNGFHVLRIANQLHQRIEIQVASPEWVIPGKAGFIPNDPGFGLQWGLHNTGQSGGFNDVDINAPEAWDILVTSRAVTVLILDDGPALATPTATAP